MMTLKTLGYTFIEPGEGFFSVWLCSEGED